MAVDTVIHLDDSRDLRELVRRAIAKIDPQIRYHGTDGASEAITWMTAAEPSRLVVLLDLDMPELDGCEVLRLLASRDLLPRCKVVMFSSSTSDADRERCLALGACRYCIKPPAWDALVAELRDVLAVDA